MREATKIHLLWGRLATCAAVAYRRGASVRAAFGRLTIGRRLATCPTRSRSGQASIEFALLYGAVILPLTFMVVFVSEMLWVWHSVVDFTRDGANYAATHCWMGGGSNVTTYMTTHVPRMIDMERFQSGEAGLQISYYSQDPATGQLTPFVCSSGADCSASCVPDAVTVSVTSYQFSKGLETFFRLPPVTIPPFATSMPIQSAGCDESGNCLP